MTITDQKTHESFDVSDSAASPSTLKPGAEITVDGAIRATITEIISQDEVVIHYQAGSNDVFETSARLIAGYWICRNPGKRTK